MGTIHVGKVFGKLTVLDGFCVRTSGGNYRQRFRVRCSCGTEYDIGAESVINGKATGCASCKKADNTRKSAAGYKHPLHMVWQSMVSRCYDVNARAYRGYGARGITVCDRWLGSRPNGEMRTIDGFHAFMEDMGERPGGKREFSIERNDNNGQYCPENCTWETVWVQQNNKRSNVRVTYAGTTRTVTQWARVLETGDVWATAADKYGVPLPEAIHLCLSAPKADRNDWQKLFGVARKPTPPRAPRLPLTQAYLDELDEIFLGDL